MQCHVKRAEYIVCSERRHQQLKLKMSFQVIIHHLLNTVLKNVMVSIALIHDHQIKVVSPDLTVEVVSPPIGPETIFHFLTNSILKGEGELDIIHLATSKASSGLLPQKQG